MCRLLDPREVPIPVPFRALLLDLDGVLVDSGPVHAAAWTALFAEHGVDFDAGRYAAEAAGKSRDTVIREVLGPHVDLERAMRRKAELVHDILATQGVRPVSGARPFVLEARRRGLPMAIATSSRMPGPFLAAAGLADLVDTVVDRSHVAAGKPAPDLFLEAARQIDVPPASCLVVEDAVVGVRAALAAGCGVAAITTTTHADDLADADVIIGELAELWSWLDARGCVTGLNQ